MAWLDVIAPIPKTLISDDERRQGVNRGYLMAAVLILLFLTIGGRRPTEGVSGDTSPVSRRHGAPKKHRRRDAFLCAQSGNRYFKMR